MGLTLLQPGTLATVQDGGRYGWQHIGLGTSGALDPWSLAQGNLLVGNPPGCAAIEFNLSGALLRIDHDALVVISGAQAEAWLGDEPLPPLAPALVRAGTQLRIGRLRRGARVYLCVSGGVLGPEQLGSRSTHLAAGLGQPLTTGVTLPVGEANLKLYPKLWRAWSESDGVVVATWWAEGLWARWRPEGLRLRMLPGPAWQDLDAASKEAMINGEFSLSSTGNRMGARLDGPTLALSNDMRHRSGPVAHGTLQLPGNGQLIVLLAERQTTGGYPRIGEVISADLPLLAQLRPGEPFGWAEVNAEQAHMALRRRVQLLWRLGTGLKARKAAK